MMLGPNTVLIPGLDIWIRRRKKGHHLATSSPPPLPPPDDIRDENHIAGLARNLGLLWYVLDPASQTSEYLV